jgi:NAD(P)-dependent dehydrogenase (short-subunit alcohol dehydrogenase family)
MGKPGSGTVVITGGASGIGLATARKAAAAGWRPYLLDVGQQNLDTACSELADAGARGMVCDVTKEDAVENAIRQAAEGGALKAVVNCAGIGMDKPAIETEVEEFRRVLDINLIGSFIVARAAVRHWTRHGQRGAIVNISSVSGLCGNKGRVAYGASKGGVNLMTLVMATELGGQGIRVNAVAPGPIDTPLARSVHTADVRRQWNERVPQGRYGAPEEVADAVCFLISDQAGYINGQILAVDGGFVNAGLAV